MKRLIILLLLLSSFLFSHTEELTADLDSIAKEQIESRFLEQEKIQMRDHPIRYDSNILIMLQGFPTKEDSAIVNELIDSLNVAIDKWDVALVPNGTANLVISINLPHEGDWKNFIQQNNNQLEIIKSTIYLDLPKEMNYLTRKKLFYYNVLRSLVVFNIDSNGALFIPGSVFSEPDPQKVNFNPVDFMIIKELYSLKGDSKSNPKQKITTIPDNVKKRNFSLMVNMLAMLFSFAFLIIMSSRGAFNNHNYQLLPFMKQSLLVVSSLTFYLVGIILITFINAPQSVIPWYIYPISTIVLFILGLIVAMLIFLIERAILVGKSNLTLEILIPMFSISFVTIVLSLIFYNIIPDRLVKFGFATAVASLAGNAILIGFGRSIFIYSRIKSENLLRKKDVELARMSELHKQAELQSLRAKINPHFLYNALNSIASLATTDARKTEQMALALSDFFKYAINREQKQLNTISEELNAIRTYLEIEKVRFGERLSFEIECSEELLNIQIPQLLIQPLVENAIKHGLSQITENGLIRILISRTENQLKIRVYDNGPAFPDGPLSGFGIQNTQERIALLYGAKATINWQNGVEKYMEISLPFGNEPVKKY